MLNHPGLIKKKATNILPISRRALGVRGRLAVQPMYKPDNFYVIKGPLALGLARVTPSWCCHQLLDY